VKLAPRWSVFGHAVIEPVGDPAQFENRTFEDIGLYIEELFVEYSADRFGARAGKLNAGFGIAWDRAAGVYGADIAEDSEISERIGLSGDWKVYSGRYGVLCGHDASQRIVPARQRRHARGRRRSQ
tara:strand:+ start:106 stop:483 length:378 start_codon:yes stop_codon:yes gene_type:complete